tara:strand:- start:56 stop:406 length:351 start_codon:yes stop_codon:yes gene_type:complete
LYEHNNFQLEQSNKENIMTLKFQYEPSEQVKKDFHNYLLMFYGKESELHSKVGMEMEDAIEYTEMYLNGNYEDGYEPGYHMWGGGDTMDRNYVLDLYLEANDLTPTDVFNLTKLDS